MVSKEVKFLIIQPSPASHHFPLLRYKYSQHPVQCIWSISFYTEKVLVPYDCKESAQPTFLNED